MKQTMCMILTTIVLATAAAARADMLVGTWRGSDILRYDEASQTLNFAAGRGFNATVLESTRLQMGESVAGRAAHERRSDGENACHLAVDHEREQLHRVDRVERPHQGSTGTRSPRRARRR